MTIDKGPIPFHPLKVPKLPQIVYGGDQAQTMRYFDGEWLDSFGIAARLGIPEIPLIRRSQGSQEIKHISPDREKVSQYRIGYAVEQGLRPYQEDAAGATEITTPNGKQLLLIVADGMGGHRKGADASNFIVKHLPTNYQYEANTPTKDAQYQSPKDALAATVAATDVAMHKALSDGNEDKAPGSTLVAAIVDEATNQVTVFNQGDSRAYVVGTDGKLKQVTTDHSWVQKYIDEGTIQESERTTHPKRNLIYKSLGRGELTVDKAKDPSNWNQEPITLQPGEKLLLCTDGLWETMSEGLMQRIIAEAKTPMDAVLELTRQSVENQGTKGTNKDNVSALVLEVPVSPAARRTSSDTNASDAAVAEEIPAKDLALVA